ncbi:MAG: hypothetical protein LBG11_04475 [Bifidobacteriaceae bacterium]|jgi:MFS family permease|nr:hypothetical protein [Bifidobacteriaceae bacterium]
MILLLGAVCALLGALLVASAWLPGLPFAAAIVAGGTGVVVLAVAILSVRRRDRQAPAIVGLAAGLATIGAGVASVVAGALVGLVPLLAGAVAATLFALMLPFLVHAERAEFFNKSGSELAVISAVRPKGGDIVVKTILLGAMPEVIHIKPGELCKMVALVDDKVVLGILRTLWRGWRANRRRR